jgi:hypothetical protein
MADHSNATERGRQRLYRLAGPIVAAIIDDNDLVRHVMNGQLEVQMPHGGRDAVRLVACRYDDGQQCQ